MRVGMGLSVCVVPVCASTYVTRILVPQAANRRFVVIAYSNKDILNIYATSIG